MTSTSFKFPISRYVPKVNGETLDLDSETIAADFKATNVLPKRIEFRTPRVS
jgi:hypothetical protein